MTSIIPIRRLEAMGIDVESMIHPKTHHNTRSVTLTIDKTMIDDTNFAGLYNAIVKNLIMDDINDTPRSKTRSS